jgi:hypothetical protein
VSDEEKKAAEEPKASAEDPKPKARRHKARSAEGKGKKDGGFVTKVVATVFGAVVAPILVAVGVAYLKPQPEPKPGATPTDKPVVTTRRVPIPGDVISLITPDLSEYFYTYAWDPALEKNVRKDTIDPALFRYEDSKPSRIVVPGGLEPAVLTTKDTFEDYVLNFEYRFGEKIWKWENVPRRACLMLHITSSDGAAGGVFPQGITVRLGDGDAGNIRLGALPGTLHCMARVKESPDRHRRQYIGPDAPEVRQESGDPEGWIGGIFRRGFPADMSYRSGTGCDGLVAGSLGGGAFAWAVRTRNPVFPVAGPGWHPDGDPAIKTVKPPYKPGEWNRVRIECIKGRLTIFVNGKRVNEVTDLNLAKGKFAIASQWSEYEIGKIEVEIKAPEKASEKPPEKRPEKGRTD